jgi:DNA-binding NtrC family response regulator
VIPTTMPQPFLPRSPVARPPHDAGPSLAREVLVVEDDDDTRDSIVELLQEHGYRVTAAANGREAQSYLRENTPPACMVLDLWMPEMNGWSLALEIQEGGLPQVPIIVVSAAEPHWGYPSRLVLRKPLDSGKLLALVARTVGQPPGEA